MKRITKPSAWCAAAIACAAWTGIAHAQSSTELQPTWTYASGNSGWIPDTVAIGNHGTRVFSAFGTFGSSARLFSESSTPIATDEHDDYGRRHTVSAAENGAVHSWLHYRGQELSGQSVPELRVYLGDAGSASWTWTFPLQVDQPFGGTAVSSDGSVVCGWVYDAATHETKVAVFDPTNSTPNVYTAIGTYFEPKEGLLSADGSTLYLANSNRTYVVDTATGELRHSLTNWFGVSSAHALSTDGMVWAQGMPSEQVRVFRDEGGTANEWFEHHVEGTYKANRADFSEDGSTLALCYDNATLDSLRVVVLDLSPGTPQVVFDHELFGGGTLNVSSAALELNTSGDRLVLGTWGDELGLLPEIVVFDRSVDGNWHESHFADLPGSVRDLSIDATGQFVAVASKAVHASELGSGGRYDRFELPSTTGLRLVGTPNAGGSVEVRVACDPGSSGMLLANDQLDATPNVYGAVGTLYLERTGIAFSSRTLDDGQGELAFTLDLADTQPGDVIHVQGLVFGPRRLTPGSLAVEVQ